MLQQLLNRCYKYLKIRVYNLKNRISYFTVTKMVKDLSR